MSREFLLVQAVYFPRGTEAFVREWGVGEQEPIPGLTFPCWSPAEAKVQFLARFLELS